MSTLSCISPIPSSPNPWFIKSPYQSPTSTDTPSPNPLFLNPPLPQPLISQSPNTPNPQIPNYFIPQSQNPQNLQLVNPLIPNSKILQSLNYSTLQYCGECSNLEVNLCTALDYKVCFCILPFHDTLPGHSVHSRAMICTASLYIALSCNALI